MKKRFMSLLAVAATLAMGFSSCSNDDNVLDRGTERSVSLKVITGKPALRAEEATQSGKETAIDGDLGGAVYFMNDGVVTDYFEIVPNSAAGVKVSDLTNGHLFTGVSGSASKVYVVMNKPAGLTLPGAGSTLTAIKAVAMNITDFTEINKVMMNGEGTITAPAAPETVHQAAVALAPVVARFEIAKVEYDATHVSNGANTLKEFKLKGIFVNNHYKTMGMNFTPTTLYSSKDAAQYTAANFPAPLAGLTGTYATTDALSYVPATGACWAYQFFPVSVATGGGLPMLVFELDVTDTNGTLTGKQFISVEKFENGGNAITEFEPNKIYKIESLKFSNRNLDPNPGVTVRDVSVAVSVTPWVDVNIIPIL